MNNENILLYLASILTLFSFFYIKLRNMTSGAILLLLYTFCAWGGYIYYKTGAVFLFNDRVSLTVEPFVYLVCVLFIFFYPFLMFRVSNYTSIEIIDKKNFLKVVKILLYAEILLIILFLPSLMSAMSGNVGDNRNAIYEGESFIAIKNPLILYVYRLVGGLKQLCIVIAFYGFIFYRKEKIMKWFLLISIAYPVFVSLIYIMRSQILLVMLLLIYIAYMFKPFISKRIWKKSMRIGLVSGVAGFAGMQAISVSRFGDMVWTFFFRYWGETFINFNNLLYNQLNGYTHGQCYFPTISKLLGLPTTSNNIEKYDLIDHVCGIDGGIFYTFIGNLCIEYGEIITFIISVAFCLINIRLLKSNNGTLRLSQLLIVGFWGWQFLGGIFTCVFQGDGGNWEIILTIILYLYFNKQKGKAILIQK